MRTADAGATAAEDAYWPRGSDRTFRVNPDGSTTPVVVVTAQSQKYDVVYTWTMSAKTWDGDTRKAAIMLKTSQVNAICDYPHVQDFRTVRDEGPSEQLYHFAIITVGDDDQANTDYVQQRMDALSSSTVYSKIDAVWAALQEIGVT